jgi:hypothetical protein
VAQVSELPGARDEEHSVCFRVLLADCELVIDRESGLVPLSNFGVKSFFETYTASLRTPIDSSH